MSISEVSISQPDVTSFTQHASFTKEKLILSKALCIDQFETSTCPPGLPREFEIFQI